MYQVKVKVEQLDWVIVGAGLHGCHLAICLLRQGLDPSRICLFDRCSFLLGHWNERTKRVGMAALRSTSVHHIDDGTWSLLDYGLTLGPQDQSFVDPYTRPRYQVFQDHCQEAIVSAGLDRVFCQGEVQSLCRDGSRFRVETNQQDYLASNVILCPGPTAPAIPDWAKNAQGRGEPVCHLFEDHFTLPTLDRDSKIAVVGGGMSGVQFAISLASRLSKVVLIGRHSLRIHDFDADPCWHGPKCLNDDFFLASLASRREQISQARFKGSINNEVFAEWKALVASGKAEEVLGEALDFSDGRVRLSDGTDLCCDHVILATGFKPGLPGGALVRQAIDSLDLPVAPCGFPILSERLEWGNGLFVSGGLAELTVGPVARNIAGARMASKRILGRPGGRFRRGDQLWQRWRSEQTASALLG